MMADFRELVNRLREPGEDGLPETIYDDLAHSYDEVLTGAAAKQSEYEAALQEREAEISRLKSQNFDLLMSQPQQHTENDTQDQSAGDDGPTGIDSLFDN